MTTRHAERSVVFAVSAHMLALACVAFSNRAAAAEANTAASGAVDFNSEVRPILSANCFKCHGPDDGQRQAGLRLDLRESALAEADSGSHAIVPGKIDESELIKRITSSDADEKMPPAGANKMLTDAQKETLRRWVAEGARYDAHWSFVTPRQSPTPAVKQTAWPRNAIDYFILAKLEAEGLTPSPEADRYTLVRRLYLDLVGLPPTPEEADAFVSDTASGAYERLVDRLLSSPEYGERWARLWLDLARYADTNGYVEDHHRSIWPYRDWVIHALNNDMPFDRFTTEQIAGDMLSGATLDQRIATGFHRNTMLNEEGGTDPLEYRFYSMVDRVNTTATTWLGLTLGCAQCHTHKYDPIPQRDYYQFLALMNNTEEPEISVPDAEVAARRAEIEAEIAHREKGIATKYSPAELEAHVESWRAEAAPRAVHWRSLRPTKATSGVPTLNILDDDSVLARGDQTLKDEYDLELSTDLKGVTAIRIEALPDDRLPLRGPGRVFYEGVIGDFFLSELTLEAGGKPVEFVRAIATHVETRPKKTGAISGDVRIPAAIDGSPRTGWAIGARVGEPSTGIFELKSPIEDATTLKLKMLFEVFYPAGMGRFRVSVSTDPIPKDINLVPCEIEALLATEPAALQPADRQRLADYYLTIAPEFAKQRKVINDFRAKMPQFPTTLVLAERPADHTRATYVHKRGDFLAATDLVQPNSLSVLPPMPAESLHNRLTLAAWLVNPDNPLVGRVTMNRHWAAFFGTGIVRTLDDFGYQGEPPSHPELLDWLAVEFAREGWSFKRMHRLIVTSATYRQESRTREDLAAKDPTNKLLGRGPRVRLQAEQIRDCTLRSSGLLTQKVGGPSVYPPQPTEATKGSGQYRNVVWKASPGEDRYRRGLYTYTMRNVPFAMFNLFDAPTGTVCVARRDLSNSPLQSLTMMNDPAIIEAAQALGREIAAAKGSVDDKATLAFRRVLTRPPTDKEAAALKAFYEQQSARLASGEIAADQVAGSDGDNKVEQAAWTAVARAMFNLDEMITKE